MKSFKFWIGIIISIIFLWLSMKNVSWTNVKESFLIINYFYLIPIFLILILAHILRAVRWQYLLIKIKKIPIFDLFSFLMITNLFLNTLPARIGEIMRAYMLGKKYNISKTACFSTIILEHLFDGFITIFILVFGLYLYNSNNQVQENHYKVFSVNNLILFVFILYFFVLIVILLLKFYPKIFKKIVNMFTFFLPEKIKTGINNLFDSFVNGLNIFNDLKSLMICILISILIWILFALQYHIGLFCFGIFKEFYLCLILMGFSIFAVLLPAAPGFIGTFHYAVQITLERFYNISPSLALSYAWVIWSCALVLNVTLGLFFYNKYNIHMNNIKNLEGTK